MITPLPDLPLVLADTPSSLRTALGQEGVPIVDRRTSNDGRFVIFDSHRGTPTLSEHQIAIDIDHLRRGMREDPFAALADNRSAVYEWELSRGGEGLAAHCALRVRESVARVDRAALREQLLSRLRTLIEAAGGAWLRLAPFPHPYRTAFNFRLDHDEYDPDDFNETLTAIEGYEHAISHYVCAATHARFPAALAQLKGAHVGSHGWWHHTYREAADNLANIGRGIDALRACGLNPAGFAAPHGRSNRGLRSALQELVVTHSSEFGLAYDDLPFFPDDGRVLQIPIHPICLGICLEAAQHLPGRPMTDGEAAEAMLEHWRVTALARHEVGEPIFFYGHPDGRIGRFPHVLRRLLTVIGQLPATWCTTLAEFEAWWRSRAAVELRVVRNGGQVQIVARGLPAGYRCAVEYHRHDRVATVELRQHITSLSSDALPWRPRPQPRSRRVARAKCPSDIRATLRSCLDWEKVTPIDEISTRTWRGIAKKALRQVRT